MYCTNYVNKVRYVHFAVLLNHFRRESSDPFGQKRSCSTVLHTCPFTGLDSPPYSLESRMRVFRWKAKPSSAELAPHEMRLATQPGSIKLLLLLRKTSPQTLPLEIVGVTEEDFDQAWTKQGRDWQQTATENVNGRFFCLRYIELGNNMYVVWRVEHIADEPYDLIDTFYGSLTELMQFYGLT